MLVGLGDCWRGEMGMRDGDERGECAGFAGRVGMARWGDAVRLWGWGDGEMGRVVCDGRLFGVVEMIGRDAWGRAGVGGDGGAGDGGMWWGRGESWMAGDISRTARCIGMDGLLGDWGIRGI